MCVLSETFLKIFLIPKNILVLTSSTTSLKNSSTSQYYYHCFLRLDRQQQLLPHSFCFLLTGTLLVVTLKYSSQSYCSNRKMRSTTKSNYVVILQLPILANIPSTKLLFDKIIMCCKRIDVFDRKIFYRLQQQQYYCKYQNARGCKSERLLLLLFLFTTTFFFTAL